MSELDSAMTRFRLASRELFNSYFHVSDPWNDEAWGKFEAFHRIENVMFKEMVLLPNKLSHKDYGKLHPDIAIRRIVGGGEIPADINRDRSSGYWDHPVKYIPEGSECRFISFFDFSDNKPRDNEFVRLCIATCQSNKDLEGRHALARAQIVEYFVVRST